MLYVSLALLKCSIENVCNEFKFSADILTL